MECRIDEDQDRQILAVFRMMIRRNPQAYVSLTEMDPDTFRETWTGGVVTYPNGPQWPKGVDVMAKENRGRLVFLLNQAYEYNDALPTLLRWQAEPMLKMAQDTSRTTRQERCRVAGALAVLVRGANEDKTKVLMAWDSMEKAIAVATGSTPSPATVKNVYRWLASGEDPMFKLIKTGERGKFTHATEIEIVLPYRDHEDWKRALDPAEQALTAAWMAENADLLGEVYADEAERKKALPERKAEFSNKYGWHIDLDTWIKGNQVKNRRGRGYTVGFPGDQDLLLESSTQQDQVTVVPREGTLTSVSPGVVSRQEITTPTKTLERPQRVREVDLEAERRANEEKFWEMARQFEAKQRQQEVTAQVNRDFSHLLDGLIL